MNSKQIQLFQLAVLCDIAAGVSHSLVTQLLFTIGGSAMFMYACFSCDKK